MADVRSGHTSIACHGRVWICGRVQSAEKKELMAAVEAFAKETTMEPLNCRALPKNAPLQAVIDAARVDLQHFRDLAEEWCFSLSESISRAES